MSKTMIPIFKDDAARSLLETIKNAKIKPYSEEKRIATEKRIKDILLNKKDK